MKQAFPILDTVSNPQWKPAKDPAAFRAITGNQKNKSQQAAFRYGASFTEVVLEDQVQKKTYRFEPPACNLSFEVLSKVQKKSKATEFADSDLSDLLKSSRLQNTNGLVYVWSPHMNLSVQGAAEAEKLASELNLIFKPALDPNASVKQARFAARNQHFVSDFFIPLRSTELLKRDANLHFPALFLFSKGRLINTTRLGYDNPDRLRRVLKETFE